MITVLICVEDKHEGKAKHPQNLSFHYFEFLVGVLRTVTEALIVVLSIVSDQVSPDYLLNFDSRLVLSGHLDGRLRRVH